MTSACAAPARISDVEAVKPLTEDALMRIGRREIENDGFNRLTPLVALSADDVIVLRAYAKYLKQAGFTYSQAYLEQTLAGHPGITRNLVALFHARFDPSLAARSRRAARRRSRRPSRRS